jgi:large subunit ribosomal protein L13
MTTTHDIDAANQSLGRIATRISVLLRGKDRPDYEPRSMPDVKVVVHNLAGIVFKGTKLETTRFYRHSGYPGGIRSRSLADEWKRSPAAVLRHAVRGMLPPNRTRDRLLKNLVIQ